MITTVDLLGLIQKNTVVRHVANTRGGEYAGACPKCGGVDRFRVQPAQGAWSCRQCHERWGDAIEYIKWFHNVGFKEAMNILGLPLDSQPRMTYNVVTTDPDAPKPLGAEYAALNDPDWQDEAMKFCDMAYKILWSEVGNKARAYLENRGITPNVMESAGLGYNPVDFKLQWGLTEVWMPRGIIIPWLIGGQLWRVNCRPPVPINGKKYIQAAGSANGLYNADAIRRFRVVIMTEGEFDSLVIRSTVPHVVPVATGAASWSRVTRWLSRLALAEDVLLAFDTDKAGADAVDWWQHALGDKAARITPTEHDITDMWKAGQSIREWLRDYDFAVSYPVSDDMAARRQQVREETIWWLAPEVGAA